ncbi:hypothetical protein [Mycolicibacterium wolinskyi]|uniref:hypothetical protein n=1 Tax=Mycolicibacterium wolinskyi TaxID=59750 RepID=UPI0039177075
MPDEFELPADEPRIVRFWDDGRAEYRYQLKVTKYLRYVTTGTSGDREWADRQAAHYGIEIEDTE